MKKVFMICFTLIIAFTMIGCTNNEYSYDFHFFVEEGEGKLSIQKTFSFNLKIQKCKDVEDMCELVCADDTDFVRLMKKLLNIIFLILLLQK